jgi:nucleoside-diphosphate-sugar epimerase
MLMFFRYAYESQAKVEVRVARIFNTFGPRMHPNDGRVVSNFIIQVSEVICEERQTWWTLL